MNKNRILFLLLLFIPISLSAQTFNSKTSGGHWNSASTWIENAVPTENSNVIVNGLVIISNQSCNNLTINTGGIIEDEPSAGRSLVVKGNFINYGIVRIGNGHAGVDLYINGSVQNYGTLINKLIRFSGSGTQTFLSTKKISCNTIDKFPDGTIQALSDIEIDSLTYVTLNSDILNMGSFKLTKISKIDIDSSPYIFSGGTVYSNGLLDIGGRFGSNLDGAFTLTGSTPLLFTGNNVVENNMIVGAGKTIADEPSAGRTIFVKGNLVNEGIIKNRHAGLWIYVKGNVVNNGTYSAFLRFEGDNNQKISGTKIFNPVIIDKFPNGTINAASDITIDSTTTFTLNDDILNMGSYKLTKLSKKDLDNSTYIIQGGTVYSNGLLDIGGRFASNLGGAFTLTGSTPLLFTGNNVVENNMIVGAGKTVADEPSSGRTIFVKGNLVNEGIIKNRHAGLWIYVKGNVVNNGTYSAFLRFEGDNNQKISGTKIFNPVIIDKFPNGTINAASDITIDSTTTFTLNDDILNMGSYKLTKLSKKDLDNSTYIIQGGTVYSNGLLDISGRFASSLDGNFTLTGTLPLLFTGGNIIKSNLRVAKDKIVQEECCSGRDITVSGDILNYGTIKNRHGGLNIYCYGNIRNYGKVEINWIIARGNNNTINLSGNFASNISLEKSGGTFANFNVENSLQISNQLVINSGATLTNGINSSLTVIKTISNSGTFVNSGTLKNRYYIYGSGQVDAHNEMFVKPWVYDRATSDSMIVTSYNNSVHPKMNSSIARWWSIQGNKKLNSYSVDLYYSDLLLNGQDPSLLDAYITTDNGATWKKISSPVNLKRDLVKKIITVGNKDNPISLTGDIILSSGNVTNLPSISVAIGGRKELRVGPPNRFTISYWNNNNYSTDMFFLQINGGQGIYIDAIQSKKIGKDSIVTIPVDSLVYNNKEEVILIVQPLAPKEVRSFDVIFKSTASVGKSNMELTLSVVAYWAVGKLVKSYVTDAMVQGCYEMWRPVRHDQTVLDASVKLVGNSLNKTVTVEGGIKGVLKEGAEEVVENTVGIAVWPLSLAKDMFDCLGNTVKGMKDYVNGNFDKQEKNIVRVTSWDPNAKEGPTGFGPNGFMSSTAPITYTIFFENKKEATAPAYQIVILDTLDQNVFDISSVQFGAVSHPNVKPTITRSGNILKWDFVGIELVPNAIPPQGEGWVKFTVNLKPNLPSATQIKNKAVIVFDINKPLATNQTINTLDFLEPSANILSLSKVSGKSEVSVAWSGSDGSGSGIKNVLIYSSIADGPFTVAAITDKSPVIIPVLPNNTYKFFVLANDNVGNSQKSALKIHEIITSVSNSNSIPNKFQLEQNYPNPFNPSTVINFSLPERSNVILDVFNTLGQRVAQLINSTLTAGHHNVKFNSNGLASGIYIYQLRTDNLILTKKMLLLK